VLKWLTLTSARLGFIVGVAVVIGVLFAIGAANPRGATRSASAADTSANSNQCRVVVTADVLNVRSAPATTAQVVAKLTKGQQSDADKTVQNGFRKVGDNRWASTQFLQPVGGRDCG
jgi:uncharacterized protein YgiM (DUF1202 family)